MKTKSTYSEHWCTYLKWKTNSVLKQETLTVRSNGAVKGNMQQLQP